MIVVSTEIVAALYLPGELTETAETILRKDPAWATPLIWRALLPHHLSAPLRAGRLPRAIADEIIAEAPKLFLSREFPSPAKENMSFLYSSNCVAFIAPFLDLAKGLGIPLVTTDAEAIRAFPDIATPAAAFAAAT